MENNQNNKPAGGEAKNAQHQEKSGGQNKGRRFHRHHRHHNNGDKKQNAQGAMDKEFFAAAEQKPEDNAAPQKKKEAQPQKQQQNKQPPKQQGNQSKNKGGKDHNQRNGGKNRNHGKNNYHRGNEQRPYDPYEAVPNEELSLEELRARIVVKSAESEKPAEESTLPATEPVVEIPEGLLTDAPAQSADTATENVEKVEVIGVRFRSSRKTYYFDPRGIKGKKGEFAVVETARGAEFGEISLANTMINASETVAPLRPVLRIASPEDIKHDEENRQKEQQALKLCQERVLAHKLEMKLIDVQYAFDNSKLLFYFTADGRVDFRDLVKDLASLFRTRIELRQIGIRDEAKMLGGLGACGRPICCSTFLPDFAQVSIKMAKDQSLSLNSTKISGLCGRLMCCLRYESDVYAEEIRLTPSNDTTVKTEDGIGTVIGSNPLAGTVKVILKDSPDTPPKQYHRSAITVIGKGKRENSENKSEKPEKSN